MTAAHGAARDRLIVALDVPGRAEALRLVDTLRPAGVRFKVGLELFTATGPALVEELVGRGAGLFLDLKFHDIPNTAAGAARAAARLGVWMFNVHAAGGMEMMRRARAAADEGAAATGRPRPLVIAVTVLTSLDARALREEVGVSRAPAEQVALWSEQAQRAGLDGVVCSPQEVAVVKEACGAGFLAVTPGVRPAWSAKGDQQRFTIPAEAVAAGADYLVVGRPITADPDPLAAARRVLDEMNA